MSDLIHFLRSDAELLVSRCIDVSLRRRRGSDSQKSIKTAISTCFVCNLEWAGERDRHPKTACPISKLQDGLR